MTPITLSAVEFICLNMRESDRAEVFGMRGHDSEMLLAKEVVWASTYGKAAIATHNGRPCAVIGVSPMWPGVWSAWSFGTDDWSKAVLQLSRYALKTLRPFILERGAHRLQCESHIEHTDAHRWLMTLGAKPEARLRGYGRDGSDYILFNWSNADVHR